MPTSGRTGWTDRRGWAEQCLWWAAGSSLCFDKPSGIGADSRSCQLSALAKQRLQFDPLPGLLPPLTKSSTFTHPHFSSQAPNTAPLAQGLSPDLGAEPSLPALLSLSIPGLLVLLCLRVPAQPGKNFILSVYNCGRRAGGDEQAVSGEMKQLKVEPRLVHPQFSTSLVKHPWEDERVCASCMSPVSCILSFSLDFPSLLPCLYSHLLFKTL